MIKPTITKVRQLCTLPFVPRLFRGSTHQTPGRFAKLSLYWQRRGFKSTCPSSGNNAESDSERCQRIIERAFEPNPPISEAIFSDLDPKHKGFAQIFTPIIRINNETHSEKCQRIINEVFGEEGTTEKNVNIIDPVNMPLAETLQATTAKEDSEKLAQKVEKVYETPLVEAHKPSIEGLNIAPKVLGGRGKVKRKATEREILATASSTDDNTYNTRQGSFKKDMPSFDELARRCLDSPSRQIDERLLREMEKLAVPPASSGGSNKGFDDSEFIQAEIMKKPRKSVENIKDEFTVIKKNEFERIHHGNLSPPFELTVGEFSSVNVRSIGGTTEESTSKHIHSNEDIPAEQMLRHSATLMAGDEIMKPSNESEHLMHDKELKHVNLTDHISVTIEEPITQDKSTADDASDVKRLEHIISAEETSPEQEITKETTDTDVIQNLLQTRIEHLTRNNIKHLHLVGDDSHIISKEKCDLLNQDPILNESSTKTIDQFQESAQMEPGDYARDIRVDTANAESDETPQTMIEHDSQFGIMSEQTTEDDSEHYYNIDYRPERFTPTHLYHPEFMCIETAPFPEPGVIIRQHVDRSDATSKRNINRNENFMNHPYLYSHEQHGSEDNANSNTWYYGQEYPIGVPENVGERTENQNQEPSDNQYEEAVIATETGRLQRKDKDKGNPDQLRATAETENPVNESVISSESFIKPLLNKSTVAHVAKSLETESVDTATDLQTELPPVNFPKLDETVSLSELLKKVRERNRFEYCREYQVHMQGGPQVDPVIGGCGKKTPPCPPPAPKCPPCPAPKPPCPPPKPPCPNPCKPKCQPPCVPRPKCPPEKKSPCDKFKKCSCVKIKDVLTLLLYLGPQLHIPMYSMLPMISSVVNTISPDGIVSKNELLGQELVATVKNLCSLVLLARMHGQVEALGSAVAMIERTDNVGFARTYDPWSPIPSWPIPEKNARQKLVCPKDGCKPPRLSAPCRDINPCTNLPKPNSLTKRSFSITSYFSEVLL